MGALTHPFSPDDDMESGMLNHQFTMQSLGELPLAASETGEVIIEAPGRSTHAVLDIIPDSFTLPTGVLPQPVTRGTGVPARTGGGGGGAAAGGGGALSTTGGIFGDLFGPNTDAIVVGLGLVVVAGLGFMLMNGKRSGSPVRRRARA
jgi:hypothetical protein